MNIIMSRYSLLVSHVTNDDDAVNQFWSGIEYMARYIGCE
jgi:hypothetical protein